MRIVGCLFFISLCATQGVQAQWSRVTLPAIPRALVFSDSLLGYFVSNQEYGFHSLDGGKDWIMVGAGLGGSLSFDEFDIGHSLNDGSATFPTQAAELRLNSDSIFWSDHVPQWYRTLGEIMYDSSYGFRMVQIISGFGTLSDSLRILVTHDDWYTSDYYGSPVVDPGFNPSGSYYTVNAARFIDSNEVWFAYGPRLIHTRDAFTFWTSTLCITDTVRNKPVWGKIYAFPKSHELYAVSLWTLAPNNIAYVYSSDDGLTWRSDSTLGGNVQFSNIPSPNQLWLMRGLYAEGSKLSTLYHSTDKGMTWSADSETFRADTITNMFWLNDRRGWIAGFAGKTGHLWHFGATAGVQQTAADQVRPFIYPNPASNQVEFVSARSGNIRIIDELGRVRPDNQIKPGKNRIDVSTLAAGVYEVIVADRGLRTSSKLLITR
jgi:hypothetical protein